MNWPAANLPIRMNPKAKSGTPTNPGAKNDQVARLKKWDMQKDTCKIFGSSTRPFDLTMLRVFWNMFAGSAEQN
ncbi:MAG: hypothetical protein COV48_09990 [Elusimicrobia bacterium CG11_big_fil_rev_8_21_14_0_20_64_6]|nr:MAG: hypothetical protein COV48_09990 [Elusimicrobia bacterium CG11_big_fil_rev_8_21_14_0_20_64_6]